MEDKITKILQLIHSDKVMEDHFFKKLADASNPLEWLLPLRDAGYFNPEHNPGPEEALNKKGYYTPHWNILDSLENMAIKNEEEQKDEVSEIILGIVNEIIAYRNDKGERVNNNRTDWKILVTISHFPINYISEQHLGFIKEALDQNKGLTLIGQEIGKFFLPKLLKTESKELIIGLLDVILHFSKIERKHYSEYTSILDSYYLKETLDKNKNDISKICAIEAANVAIGKIWQILRDEQSEYNYIWIPAIEDHEQNHFPDKYEIQLVHFIRNMLQSANPKEIEPLVKEMLGKEHEIFKRLAYHMISYHYGNLSHIFWNITYNPLEILWIHELWELFKSNSKNFEKSQLVIVLNWLETKEYYYPDSIKGSPGKEKHLEAYYKKEWLLALIDSENEEVKRRFEEYNSINDAEIKHPGFHSWSSGAGVVEEISPIDEVAFKEKTSAKRVEYINSYKESKETFSEDFTRVNLATSIRRFVSKDPAVFSKDLNPYLSLPRKYQYEFLRGFEEAWRNNKDFDWTELLPFMKELIIGKSLWSEGKNEAAFDYNRWIVDTIAELIQEGTRDDKHAFSSDLLPMAEEIILLLLSKVSTDMQFMHNLVDSVLTSSKGKVYVAAINYSLRFARLYCQDKEDKWLKSIQDEFTNRLDKEKEEGVEFSTIMGWYLLNLNFLNKKWVLTNFNIIFDLDSEKHWEAAFTGYIVMNSTVHKEIYKLLLENGHYEKGLYFPFEDKQVIDKLVQNIIIGYLTGWDDLANAKGLLRKLLDADNVEYISQVVSFMWSFRNKEEEEFRSKIKPLWKEIISKVEPRIEEEEYRKIASDLGRWFCFVDQIDDEIFKWLLISVKEIEVNWNTGYLIEYFLKHVRKTPALVGKLYLEMLDSGIYADYSRENIITFIKALYNFDEKEIADRICNMYLQEGFEFLRDTFDKNN